MKCKISVKKFAQTPLGIRRSTSSGRKTWTFMLLFTLLSLGLKAQAPNITYGFTTSKVYSMGNAITPLTVSNSGGAAILLQVGTFAGSGQGYADGVGIEAQFSYPQGIAIDASGNTYVVDANNRRIRKITSSGVVTTLAGNTYGFADGTGAAAKFWSPQDVAVDASGNVYVTDSGNDKIRKITPAGEVTTFAGSGVQGRTNGTGTSAQFYNPISLAFDASGNLYVSDDGYLRKITPAGVVSSFNDNFSSIAYIAIDTWGTIYGSDFYSKIKKTSKYAILPALPAGLSFNSATGTISGTPTANSNTTTYTITASNTIGTSTTSINISVAGGGYPTLTINTTDLNDLTTNQGQPSSNYSLFTIAGTNFANDVTITAPTNFELSLAGGGYSSSLTIRPTSGILNSATIFVRIAATALAGTKTGNIVISSTGATSSTVALSGTVNNTPTSISNTNQTISIYSHQKTIVVDVPQISQVSICDVTGRIIYTNTLNAGLTTIPLNAVAGVYVVKVTENEQITTKKVVVE